MKVCSDCGEDDQSKLRKDNRVPDGVSSLCNECGSNRYREDDRLRKLQRVDKRKAWIGYFKELGKTTCGVCGYDKCFAAIDFHHRDPEDKLFNIAAMTRHAFNDTNKTILLSEIRKCDVLCANCHRELHDKER